jgi:hypothetical protein
MFGLRNATAVDHGVIGLASGVPGSRIAAFGESVAVPGVTGNVLDADLLHALIARLADLLGEPLPPDV